MTTTVRQLAELVRGQVQGDGDRALTGARTLDEAGPEHITFIEHARQATSAYIQGGIRRSRISSRIARAQGRASV